MKCDDCGAELQVGQWPWCPHEDAHNFGEAPLEPYWDEHLDSNPIHVTTRHERRQIMARNNLEYHDVSRKKRGRIYSFMGGK